MNKKILTYDIEIAKAILGAGEQPEGGIEYVTPLSPGNPGSAWANKRDMGISVLCAHSGWNGNYHVIMGDNVSLLRELINEADFVVGFNNWGFDDPLLLEVWGIEIPQAKKLDWLVEVWRAHGLSDKFYYRTHGGFKLDQIINVNYGINKLNNGADAPKLWQRGQLGELISYCLNDVQVTVRMGADLVNGQLLSPKVPGQYCSVSHSTGVLLDLWGPED